jgi:histidinol-phosphatase (PHP family)
MGFHILGFSDHTPWQYASPDFVSRIRMLPSDLAGYVQKLQELRQKYADQIHIYIGLEAEYFPDYMDWLLEQKEALGIDYLILGCHYDTTDEHGMYFGRSTTPEHVRRYVECAVAGMETGAYRYLAHPDLYLYRYPTFDETAAEAAHTICRTAAKLDLPLEYNLAGLVCRPLRGEGIGYTTDEFWRIAAKYPVKAIIGCDAHAPCELECPDLIAHAQEHLRALGIPVLDTLPGME